jgi:hypothetical protein
MAVISNVAGYYLWPAVWVDSPIDLYGERPDLRMLEEEKYRATLPSGITAKVLRGGVFLFDFSGWPPGRALPGSDTPGDLAAFDAKAAVILQRVAVMNAHLACLYTALSRRQKSALEKMIVSPDDRISMLSLDTPGWSSGDMRTMALLGASYATTYSQLYEPIFDWRMTFRGPIVETDTVRDSFELLSGILDQPASYALLLADLYARSCKAFEEHNYPLCVITAWAISEKLLRLLWERYVEANRERTVEGKTVVFINKNRKERLTKDREFTAGMISEFLSLTNALPFPLYQQLTEIRKARNAWMHDLRSMSRELAELSVNVAEQMLRLVDGIDLHAPLIARLNE